MSASIAFLDRRDLTVWYPAVAASGVLTPETVIVAAPDLSILTEEGGNGFTKIRGYGRFLEQLADAGDQIGWPCFLRTAHGSARHQWKKTCYLDDPSRLHGNVTELVRWSQSRKLPFTHWSIRQFVPLAAYLEVYNGVPVSREFRVRIEGDQVFCLHPAWTRRSVEMGNPKPHDWMPLYEELADIGPVERRVLLNLSAHVGRFLTAAGLGGGWVLDWAMVSDGRWVLIDCDDPQTAWHWPECAHHPSGKGGTPIDPKEYAVDKGDQDPLMTATILSLERSLDEDFSV